MRARRATGLLALAAVALAGCGSGSHGRDYSPRQVTAAFASQGISLHRNTNVSEDGAYWLSTRDRGPDGDPGVIAVVLTRPSAGQFSFQQKGNTEQLKRLGDVRVVWTKKSLDTRVEAALGKLGQDGAPPEPKATAPASSGPTSFAQSLAEIPQPLRTAVRKTAAAPSAHVSMTGQGISGSGEYSTVKQIGELQMKVFCITGDEVIDGTTMYTRGSSPGKSKKFSRKWAKQDLPANSSAATRYAWPRAQLFTFAPPLGMLASAGHVSNLGDEKIGGVETTHYQAHLADFRKGLPSTALPGMGDIDVWVDKRDGYIRRAQVDFGATETVNLSHFGEQVHVKIPPADETVDAGKKPGHGKLIVSSGSTSGGCVSLKP